MHSYDEPLDEDEIYMALAASYLVDDPIDALHNISVWTPSLPSFTRSDRVVPVSHSAGAGPSKGKTSALMDTDDLPAQFSASPPPLVPGSPYLLSSDFERSSPAMSAEELIDYERLADEFIASWEGRDD